MVCDIQQSRTHILACWITPKEFSQADGKGALLGGIDAKVHVHPDVVKRQAHVEPFIVVEVRQDVAESPAVVAFDGQGEAFANRCFNRDYTTYRDVACAASPVSARPCQRCTVTPFSESLTLRREAGLASAS